jgi:5'-nucleotidase
MTKPLILVTNDDGIFAPGIAALVEVARTFGEVVVVAPDKPQSGMGHGITLHDPLRLKKVETFVGLESYECSGTPADCVKLAKHVILKGRKVDLCLSGVNHGSNSSINIIYSGTMSAAMEGAMEGIPSVGFSLCDYSHTADFEATKKYVDLIIRLMLDNRFKHAKLLNVNIPKLPYNEILGMKVCRQAKGRYIEDFIENKDPSGKTYYWLSGKFIAEEATDDTDIHALQSGYVSIVPSWNDMTDYQALEEVKSAISHVQP